MAGTIKDLALGTTMTVDVPTAGQASFLNKIIFEVVDVEEAYAGQVTFMAKGLLPGQVWGASGNEWSAASLQAWLNNASTGFLSKIPPGLASQIQATNWPTIQRASGNPLANVSAKVALPSSTEMGLADEVAGKPEGKAFQRRTLIAYNQNADGSISGTAAYWWLRTPNISNASYARSVTAYGSLISVNVTNSDGARPLFNLSSSILISTLQSAGCVFEDAAPPPAPASITAPALASGGVVGVFLPALTNDAWTYEIEGSVDGGATYDVIGTGRATYLEIDVPDGNYMLIRVRVKGLFSASAYITSPQLIAIAVGGGGGGGGSAPGQLLGVWGPND